MGIGSTLMAGIGLGDPVIRLGVTGLSRAGKTVFITSLVANLMDRGRMHALRAAADGSIKAAWLQPQPDDTVPRFDFERHLASLTGPEPQWPEGTRHVSQLRLSLRGRYVSRRCFVGSATKLILPALGALTGGLDAGHGEIRRAVGPGAAALVPVADRLLRFPLA